jgi:Photoprotection regulator fluorescence recovery protein
MAPHDLKWSGSEKKIARCAFEAAFDSTLAGIMSEFKEKAAAAATPSEMWAIEDYLRRRRREVDEMFDYRYSQLPVAFAQLICHGYLDEAQLAGLSDEKLDIIRRLRSLMKERQLP